MTAAERIKIAAEGVTNIINALKDHPSDFDFHVWVNEDGPVYYVKLEKSTRDDHKKLIELVSDAGYLNINSLDEDNPGEKYTSTHLFIKSAH